MKEISGNSIYSLFEDPVAVSTHLFISVKYKLAVTCCLKFNCEKGRRLQNLVIWSNCIKSSECYWRLPCWVVNKAAGRISGLPVSCCCYLTVHHLEIMQAAMQQQQRLWVCWCPSMSSLLLSVFIWSFPCRKFWPWWKNKTKQQQQKKKNNKKNAL